MIIYVWDLAFGNCAKGIHRFESFLVKYTPSGQEITLKGYASDYVGIIESMAEKSFEIRCKHCGRKAE